MTVYKQDVLDLTLVDLPGITRNPIAGQAHDIETQVTNMIHKYISPSETVILNVVSADIDFATSGSMKMSKKVDPKGLRTIGVVTKIDRAEKGIGEKLLGVGQGSLELPLGYVAVRNRTPEENEKGISFELVRELETVFFETHPELLRVPSQFKGTYQLSKKLSELQMSRIREILPEKANKISKLRQHLQSELGKFPKTIKTKDEAYQKFVNCVSTFKTLASELFDGRNKHAPKKQDLHAPARVNSIIRTYAQKLLSGKSLQTYLEPGFEREITKSLKESAGSGLVTFASSSIFGDLVSTEIEDLEKDTLHVVVQVKFYMQKFVTALCQFHFEHFPFLQKAIQAILFELLDELETKCHRQISEYLKKESEAIMSYNTNYLEIESALATGVSYYLNSRLMKSDEKKSSHVGVQSRKDLERGIVQLSVGDPFHVNVTRMSKDKTIRDLQIKMVAYFKVASFRLLDNVAMEVLYRYLTCFGNEMTGFIMNYVQAHKEFNVLEVMSEPPTIRKKREGIQKRYDALNDAWKELKKLEHTSVLDPSRKSTQKTLFHTLGSWAGLV